MLISVLTGFAAGAVHVVSGADHMVAMAPSSVRKPRVALINGLAWGIGHSAGIHCSDSSLPHLLAERVPVARVLVNQAHALGNGGSFDNGLPFSLSMGCGTWAGNSISENLNISHFINTTHLVETCKVDEPTAVELFEKHCRSVSDLDSLPTK